MYYVAGFNIFGQWSSENLLMNKFHVITHVKQSITGVTFKITKLLQVNWSYNIIQFDEDFYLAGYLNDKENQLIKLPIQTDHLCTKNDITVVGNDHNFILVDKNNNCTIKVGDLNLKTGIKNITLNVEIPVGNSKKLKQDIGISKVVLVNESCIYLTSLGTVYNGILPSYIDTEHCRGNICDVQCGYEHFLLLTDNGSVYTWGNSRRLQLGHGNINNIDIPTEVEALAGINITKICSGGWHTLALSESGDLYAWGWNDTGQLGIKQNDVSNKSYSVPTLVEIYDSDGIEVAMNVIDIACGSRHSAILLEDKTVWTTGFNKYGQLGFSETGFPSISYFKKAFECDDNCTLMCGPWTTVIISKQNN